LPEVLKPRAEGGVLHHRGQVEVVSSIERDGEAVFRDLRWGVYVTFAAESEYVRRCFSEYGLRTDKSGNYAAMYKPYHLIGLELGITVGSVGLRREPTGVPTEFRADAVAFAKRDLAIGDTLDGEGGYTVFGKLLPAAQSLHLHSIPIGLAHGMKLNRRVSKGHPVTWNDIQAADSEAVRTRRELERLYALESGGEKMRAG
jgi:predicted homoserine dehydrogenase-like protein